MYGDALASGRPRLITVRSAVAMAPQDATVEPGRVAGRRVPVQVGREGAMLAPSCRRRGLLAALVVLIAALAPAAATAHSRTAPGAPGAKAWWTPADKDGFGTAASLDSKLWHTLEQGELTEVYYPDLGTPSIRDLQLVVTDGRTF